MSDEPVDYVEWMKKTLPPTTEERRARNQAIIAVMNQYNAAKTLQASLEAARAYAKPPHDIEISSLLLWATALAVDADRKLGEFFPNRRIIQP